MNKKRKLATAIAIFLFMIVALEVVYIFSELYSENEVPTDPVITDAVKFKEEYESLNGTKNANDRTIRSITIDEDNPFIYATEDDIVKMIDNKETFVVYFGFTACPWCRSILESLITSAKENNITKIYYVNVLDIRDKYELNDKNKAIRTVEGTEGYYALLDRLGSVLDDYSPLTYKTSKNKTKEVKIGEKRIYAPNIVTVKNGEAVSMETAIVDSLVDPYMELTNEMTCEMKEIFKCLFDTLNDDVEVCEIDAQKC
ncbi:MAG: hypothetical protein J1F35_04205 [Erysipelotrichales bacterium]|nr:hypothetical protein [Erysipelotrichales bacterium]